MADFEYKIIKEYGTIAKHDDITLELKLISWNGGRARYDLRPWKNSKDPKTKQTTKYAMKGLTLSKDELRKLGELIRSLKGTAFTKESFLKIVENIKKDNPIETKKRGRPAKTIETKDEVEDEDEDDVKEETKPTNIIQFPKPRPEIKKAVTSGNATYADCEEKLGKDKEMFVDSDSQYVLDGLLELCKVDQNFRNNVMREGRDFTGVMTYMKDMCQKGYGYKGNGWGWVDRNLGLGLAIDYFNLENEPNPKKTDPKPKKSKSNPKKKRKAV